MMNTKLLSVIETLQKENEQLRVTLRESAVDVEQTVEEYSKALEDMKLIAEETDSHYDKILRSMTTNDKVENLEATLADLEEKYKSQSSTLKETEAKLKFFFDRNTQRRDSRHKETVKKLREKLKEFSRAESELTGRFEGLVNEKESLITKVDEKANEIDKLLKTKVRLQKRCSDWKGKAIDREGKQEKQLEEKQEEIDRQWLRIRELEKSNKELEELLDSIDAKKLNSFDNGRYMNDIRQVIMKVHSMNISTRNICPAIKVVLEDLANVEVDRLPSYGVVNKIMYEAKCISPLNAGRASLRDKESKKPANILMNDGT